MIAANHTMRLFIASLLLQLMLVGCDEKVVYHQYHNTLVAGWDKKDTLTFCIPPLETTANYQITLGLRTVATYPYTSIWIVVRQDFNLKPFNQIDTLECKLYNNNGEQSGQGIINYLHVFPLYAKTLPKGVNGKIRVYHIMRREELPGISQVGIKISK